MCKICIFAGTTEARRLVELLSTQPVSVTACVATEYGETLLPEGGNVTVRSGRIPVDGIIQMLSDTKFDLVIDATHPYAASITESAARACAETGTEYLRLLREESDKVSDFTCVLNAEAAALFLSKTDGNILLTTGSKDLKTYSKVKDFTDRAYARVLPLDASLALCREAGVQPSHILAMQGPFSEEMDTAMLRAVSAKWLVTKDGGEAGGFAAKVAAARKAGANVLVIGRPKQREGKSFSQVLDSLERRFGFRFAQSVKIVGIGPGSRDAMTQEARRAIEEADCLIGARRMLDAAAPQAADADEGAAVEKDSAASGIALGLAQCVQIDGVLYFDTGSAVDCPPDRGADGVIETSVDRDAFPETDGCSNFGTGYSYWVTGDDVVVVEMDGVYYEFAAN